MIRVARVIGVLVVPALLLALALLLVAIRSAEAIKPGACTVELEHAKIEIEHLETELRLRSAELRVVRGQLAACERHSAR